MFTYPPDQSWRPEDDITLLGDAAHVAPLFTGKEADYAILDAFELADCLAADRFPDIPSARAEYEHGMLTRKPERRAKQRSGHLSGGQRQRALIAAAIAAHPRILIADEPTTALDATVQRQILLLLRSTAERGSANLLMTRDLGVVSEVADDVAVMKDGQIVETGRTEAVLRYPRHAYTRPLLAAVPAGKPQRQRLSSAPAAAATGWTECAPLLVREQTVLTTALTELRKLLPFPLLGFDTDNNSVFINDTVHDYCLRDGIELTRCRPYRKNDQAFVEQKNGAIVRKIVGYRRFEGLKATHELAKLYALTRLFINFFQPSFKLKEKHRDGSKVIKRYHRSATPHQRLLADTRTSQETRDRLTALYVTLDPVLLLRDIRRAQERLVAIADTAPGDPVLENGAIPLGVFLEGLRIAWRGGEVRPTALAKPPAKRERRRPDPILAVTVEPGGMLSRGEHQESCSNGCRPNTRACILTA